jgi:uncharacterized protein
MPHIPSSYCLKGWLKSGHLSTIYSAKLRRMPPVAYDRERIRLSDGDFIDLDWSYAPKKTLGLVILLHGLEGNAQRSYVVGQAHILLAAGYDVCAMNFRGCSGQMNERLVSYNAGKIDDLEDVMRHLITTKKYTQLNAIGFSLGGSLLLNYLGKEMGHHTHINRAIAISTPLDLSASMERLAKPDNRIYQIAFLQTLKKKYRRKQRQFPKALKIHAMRSVHSLMDFDNVYTAPVHGYDSGQAYYTANSPINWLPNIKCPTLILNAQNDTFLSKECLPIVFAKAAKNIYLETPKHGGHVGFYTPSNIYYSETRALEFLTQKI